MGSRGEGVPAMSETVKVERLRDLDTLVAERVLGLKVAAPTPQRFVRMGDTLHPNHVPRYSSDISAAWEVVRRMREDGAAMTLSCDSVLAADPIFWRAIFEGATPRKGIAVAIMATLAITLAALRSKGINVELSSAALEAETEGR